MAPKPYFRAIFPIFLPFFLFSLSPVGGRFLFFFPFFGPPARKTYSVAGQRGLKPKALMKTKVQSYACAQKCEASHGAEQPAFVSRRGHSKFVRSLSALLQQLSFRYFRKPLRPPPDPRSPKTPQQQKKKFQKPRKPRLSPKVDAGSPKVNVKYFPKSRLSFPKSKRSFPKSKR